jgi:hypothetical protein
MSQRERVLEVAWKIAELRRQLEGHETDLDRLLGIGTPSPNRPAAAGQPKVQRRTRLHKGSLAARILESSPDELRAAHVAEELGAETAVVGKTLARIGRR